MIAAAQNYADLVKRVLSHQHTASSVAQAAQTAYLQSLNNNDLSLASSTQAILDRLESTNPTSYISALNQTSASSPSDSTADSYFFNALQGEVLQGTGLAFGYSALKGQSVSVNSFVDPTDEYVQAYVQSMKENGQLKSTMTFDQKVLSIYNHVIENFDYVKDKKDSWNFASETIKAGAGDCEDLTILMMSLVYAAGLEDGISADKLSQKLNGVVGRLRGFDEHVYMEYQTDDGKTYVLDPSLRLEGKVNSFSQLTSAQSRRQDMDVYFSFNEQYTTVLGAGVSQESNSDLEQWYLPSSRIVNDNPEIKKEISTLFKEQYFEENDSDQVKFLKMYNWFVSQYDVINENTLSQPPRWAAQSLKAGNASDLTFLFANYLLEMEKQSGASQIELSNKYQLVKTDIQGQTAYFIKMIDEDGQARVIDFSQKYYPPLRLNLEKIETLPFAESLNITRSLMGATQFPLADFNFAEIKTEFSLSLTDPVLNADAKQSFAASFGLQGFVVQKDLSELSATQLASLTNWDPKFDPFKSPANGRTDMSNAPRIGDSVSVSEGVLDYHWEISKPQFRNRDSAGIVDLQNKKDAAAAASAGSYYKAGEVFQNASQIELAELSDWGAYVYSDPNNFGYLSVDQAKYEQHRQKLRSNTNAYQAFVAVAQAMTASRGTVVEVLGIGQNAYPQAYKQMDVKSIASKEASIVMRGSSEMYSDLTNIVNARNQMLEAAFDKWINARQNYINNLSFGQLMALLAVPLALGLLAVVSAITVNVIVPIMMVAGAALMAAVLTAPAGAALIAAAMGIAAAGSVAIGGMVVAMGILGILSTVVPIAPARFAALISGIGIGALAVGTLIATGTLFASLFAPGVAVLAAISFVGIMLSVVMSALTLALESVKLEAAEMKEEFNGRIKNAKEAQTARGQQLLAIDRANKPDNPNHPLFDIYDGLYSDIPAPNLGRGLASDNRYIKTDTGRYMTALENIDRKQNLFKAYTKLYQEKYYSRSVVVQELMGISSSTPNANLAALADQEFGMIKEHISTAYQLEQQYVAQYNKYVQSDYERTKVSNGFYAKLTGFGIGTALWGIPYVGGPGLWMAAAATIADIANYSLNDENYPTSNYELKEYGKNEVVTDEYNGKLIKPSFGDFLVKEPDGSGSIKPYNPDGYVMVDYDAIRRTRKEFSKINNLVRALIMIKTHVSECRNQVHQELTQNAGRRYGSGLMEIYDREKSFLEQALNAKLEFARIQAQTHNSENAQSNGYHKSLLQKIPFVGALLMYNYDYNTDSSDYNIQISGEYVGSDIDNFTDSSNAKNALSRGGYLGLDLTLGDSRGMLNYDPFLQYADGKTNYDESKTNTVVASASGLAELLQEINQHVLTLNAYGAMLQSVREARRLIHQELTGIGGADTAQLAKSAVSSEGRRLNQDFMSVVNMTSELSNLITRHATARAAQTKSLLTSLASLLGVFSIFAGPSFAFAVAGMVSSTIEFAFTIVDYFNNPAWSNEINKQDRLNKLTAKTGNKAEDATRSQIAKLLSAGNEGDAAVAQAELRRLNKLKEQLAKIHESGGNSNVRGALGKASRTPGGLGSEAVSAESSLIEGLTNITTNNFASKQQFESSKQGKALGLINASIGVLQSGFSLSQSIRGMQKTGFQLRSFKDIGTAIKNNSNGPLGTLGGVLKGVFNLGQSVSDQQGSEKAAGTTDTNTSDTKTAGTTDTNGKIRLVKPGGSEAQPAADTTSSDNTKSTGGAARGLIGALGPVGMFIAVNLIRLVAGQLSANDLMNSDNFSESTNGEIGANGKQKEGTGYKVNAVGGDSIALNSDAAQNEAKKNLVDQRQSLEARQTSGEKLSKADQYKLDLIKETESILTNGENAKGKTLSTAQVKLLSGEEDPVTGRKLSQEERLKKGQDVVKKIAGEGKVTDPKQKGANADGSYTFKKNFETFYNPEKIYKAIELGLSALKNVLDVVVSQVEKDKVKKELEDQKETIKKVVAAMLAGKVPQHQILDVLASLMGQQKQLDDKYSQAANSAFSTLRANFEVGAIDRGWRVDPKTGEVRLNLGAQMPGGLLAAAFEGGSAVSQIGSKDQGVKADYKRLQFDDQHARESLGIPSAAEISKLKDGTIKDKLLTGRKYLDDYRSGKLSEDEFRSKAKEFLANVGYLVIQVDKVNLSKNEAEVAKDTGKKVDTVSAVKTVDQEVKKPVPADAQTANLGKENTPSAAGVGHGKGDSKIKKQSELPYQAQVAVTAAKSKGLDAQIKAAQQGIEQAKGAGDTSTEKIATRTTDQALASFDAFMKLTGKTDIQEMRTALIGDKFKSQADLDLHVKHTEEKISALKDMQYSQRQLYTLQTNLGGKLDQYPSDLKKAAEVYYGLKLPDKDFSVKKAEELLFPKPDSRATGTVQKSDTGILIAKGSEGIKELINEIKNVNQSINEIRDSIKTASTTVLRDVAKAEAGGHSFTQNLAQDQVIHSFSGWGGMTDQSNLHSILGSAARSTVGLSLSEPLGKKYDELHAMELGIIPNGNPPTIPAKSIADIRFEKNCLRLAESFESVSKLSAGFVVTENRKGLTGQEDVYKDTSVKLGHNLRLMGYTEGGSTGVSKAMTAQMLDNPSTALPGFKSEIMGYLAMNPQEPLRAQLTATLHLIDQLSTPGGKIELSGADTAAIKGLKSGNVSGEKILYTIKDLKAGNYDKTVLGSELKGIFKSQGMSDAEAAKAANKLMEGAPEGLKKNLQAIYVNKMMKMFEGQMGASIKMTPLDPITWASGKGEIVQTGSPSENIRRISDETAMRLVGGEENFNKLSPNERFKLTYEISQALRHEPLGTEGNKRNIDEIFKTPVSGKSFKLSESGQKELKQLQSDLKKIQYKDEGANSLNPNDPKNKIGSESAESVILLRNIAVNLKENRTKALTAQVNTAKADFDKASKEVRSMERDVAGLQSKMEDLQAAKKMPGLGNAKIISSQIEALRGQIQTLNNKISFEKNKTEYTTAKTKLDDAENKLNQSLDNDPSKVISRDRELNDAITVGGSTAMGKADREPIEDLLIRDSAAKLSIHGAKTTKLNAKESEFNKIMDKAVLEGFQKMDQDQDVVAASNDTDKLDKVKILATLNNPDNVALLKEHTVAEGQIGRGKENMLKNLGSKETRDVSASFRLANYFTKDAATSETKLNGDQNYGAQAKLGKETLHTVSGEAIIAANGGKTIDLNAKAEGAADKFKTAEKFKDSNARTRELHQIIDYTGVASPKEVKTETSSGQIGTRPVKVTTESNIAALKAAQQKTDVMGMILKTCAEKGIDMPHLNGALTIADNKVKMGVIPDARFEGDQAVLTKSSRKQIAAEASKLRDQLKTGTEWNVNYTPGVANGSSQIPEEMPEQRYLSIERGMVMALYSLDSDKNVGKKDIGAYAAGLPGTTNRTDHEGTTEKLVAYAQAQGLKVEYVDQNGKTIGKEAFDNLMKTKGPNTDQFPSIKITKNGNQSITIVGKGQDGNGDRVLNTLKDDSNIAGFLDDGQIGQVAKDIQTKDSSNINDKKRWNYVVTKDSNGQVTTKPIPPGQKVALASNQRFVRVNGNQDYNMRQASVVDNLATSNTDQVIAMLENQDKASKSAVAAKPGSVGNGG